MNISLITNFLFKIFIYKPTPTATNCFNPSSKITKGVYIPKIFMGKLPRIATGDLHASNIHIQPPQVAKIRTQQGIAP